MSNLNSVLKSRDIILPTKVHVVKAMVFQQSLRMWGLSHKEGWALKNWCFWTVVLEKTLESPLDSKEIKPVNLKGYQSWIFIGRSDAEAEAPVLWPPDVKSQLTGKDPDDGKDRRWEEKGTTEDEMVGWPHRLNRHEFGRQWRIGKPGVLQSMGLQSIRHDLATKQPCYSQHFVVTADTSATVLTILHFKPVHWYLVLLRLI